MSTLLLSDAHLRGVEDPNQRALIGFLEAVPFDRLVVVGDLFDVWWDGRRAVDLQFVPVLGLFERLVRRGVHVTWVSGNHDRSPAVQALGVQVGHAWSAEVAGRRLLAVHGDEGADPRIRDRLARRALGSRWLGVAARVAGPERVARIGGALSGASRDRPAPLHQVLARQNSLADRLLGATCDVLFVGHSHAPGMVPRRAGTLVNLGDWVGHRTYARVDEDTVRLYHWTGDETPLPAGPPQRWPWLVNPPA
jgi:UDP-2,3-diacylglucosamine hydrolase